MTAPPKLTRLLTFAELADELKLTGPDRVRRLRRRLLADKDSARFLVRVSSPRSHGKRAHYRIAWAPLLEYHPQLKDHHAETIVAARRAVAEMAATLTERIDGIAEDVEALGAETGKRLREMGARVSVTERKVLELEKRGQARLFGGGG